MYESLGVYIGTYRTKSEPLSVVYRVLCYLHLAHTFSLISFSILRIGSVVLTCSLAQASVPLHFEFFFYGSPFLLFS